jgi:hypothetical protein
MPGTNVQNTASWGRKEKTVKNKTAKLIDTIKKLSKNEARSFCWNIETVPPDTIYRLDGIHTCEAIEVTHEIIE